MTKHALLTTLLAALLTGLGGCPLGLPGSDDEDDAEVEYVGEVKNATGTVSQRTAETFIIFADEETVTGTSVTVFQPLNLPEAFHQDSLRVVFSGKLIAPHPLIRYLGGPLELDKIRRHDQD